jgi:hypothetical protein
LEELSRRGINEVLNMGIGGGEHVARAYLWAKQGDYGDATEETLFGVASESTAFMSSAQMLLPYSAVAPLGTGAAGAVVAKPQLPGEIAEEIEIIVPTLGPELENALPTIGTEASALFQARDQAAETARRVVQQGLNNGWIKPAQQQARFGTWLDALAKTNVRRAVAEGRLPSTFVTSPTVSLSRGYQRAWISAPDVWDTATGRAWDFMSAREASFYAHESRYLGSTAVGSLDPGGTAITEINPIFHLGF